MAIEQKLEDIASLLITKLSDQDLKGKNKKGDTPLHLAIEHNLDDVVLSLVKKFSTIEDLCDKDKKEEPHYIWRCVAPIQMHFK